MTKVWKGLFADQAAWRGCLAREASLRKRRPICLRLATRVDVDFCLQGRAP